MESLRRDLRRLGGDLLVIDAVPQKGFPKLLEELSQKPAMVSFNRDYEPFARSRDAQVTDILEQNLGVPVVAERDHLLIEPLEIRKDDGSFYQVYTPFARRWFASMVSPEIKNRIDQQKEGLKLLKKLSKPGTDAIEPLFQLKWNEVLKVGRLEDALARFKAENSKRVTIPIPEAGSAAAWKALEAFEKKIDVYTDRRDFPAEAATSGLSVFFKNGSMTTAQVIAYLDLNREKFVDEKGSTRFLKELVWREFFYHILYHCPKVEHEAFNEKYRNLKWENREDYFEAWKEGRTGYPIVDAGMRELNQTGRMHNRVRMIVASFLTKDLLIDWRWGERYFMEKLLDGDLAPNNGGWQWAASTGCDPQPYFRIFNPTSQARKFDPQGAYIRRYLPEGAAIDPKTIHEPRNPIVLHEERRPMALALFSR